MAVNQGRSASPEIHSWGEERLVVLPRLMKDDYNVFVQDGAIRSERLTEAFTEGMRKLRALGGLAVVDTHTQILGDGTRLDAVRAVGESVRSDGDWWTATAGEVAEWWEARSEVRVSFLAAGASSAEAEPDSLDLFRDPEAVEPPPPALEVLVESPRDLGPRELWIDLSLPDDMGDLKPFVDGVPVPFRSTAWGMKVPMGTFEAGVSRILSLRIPVQQ
jgi:hypothetical protein